MHTFKTALIASVVGIGATSAAHALTQDFAVDVANSSVTLTQTGSGIVCTLTNCGVEASLDADLASTSFTLAEGQSSDWFDFINITGDFDFSGGLSGYEIEATLAFDPPTSSATVGGSGGALTFFGFVVGTDIQWTSVPGQITAANGAKYTVDFEDGVERFWDNGNSLTTMVYDARVTLDAAPSPVPLPAGALLLGTALAGFGVARRRKAA